MINTVVIEHKYITQIKLNEIVEIKLVFGDFTLKEQLQWITNNLQKDDRHLLVYKNNILVGYAILIAENLQINNINHKILGIGNVCTSRKGQKFGTLLMKEINLYLKNNHKIGLLFCKSNMLEFYSKYNWEIVNPDYSKSTKWMIYNINNIRIDNIKYNGRLF